MSGHYVIKPPATVEAALARLQAAERLAECAADVVAEARQRVEFLRQKRRASLKVVGGSDSAGSARA